MRNQCKPWTPEDETLLRKLWSSKTRTELAAIFGRAPTGVANKASKLHLIKHGNRRLVRKDFNDPAGDEKGVDREQCKAAQLNYLRAVVKANDGCSWGGHLSSVEFNAAGNRR